MQVFKTYFKIINASKNSLLIYLLVFLGIAFMTSKSFNSSPTAGFTETKINIAVVNRDTESNVIKGLIGYLSKTSNIVDVPDDTEKLQDMLFFRKIEYIAIIPKGFTEHFGASSEAHIETVAVPDSISAVYVDILIDRYLQALRLTADFSGLPSEDQARLVSQSLSAKADIQMKATHTDNNSTGYLFYFNFFAYIILAISTIGLSTIMMVFNQPDLKRRNLCSPIKQRSMSVQLALGSIIYSLFCWALIVLFGIILYGKPLLTSGLLPILALNSLVFTIVCTAIGFLVGILIKSYNVQAAITNVVSLGMSFLCGVMVPQELLGDGVLRVASFLPAYWYIRANRAIGTSGLKAGNDIITPMLIQLSFALAIFSVTLFISKQKRTANQ
ncbi:MAG TPA: ABC transporter permease [Ruminococcaceae bacterium]|jgi:ABC-2 type transport system permease protein|nr:ABC transporter permease [Oscillospiraceae bacterium]HCA30395.1 ABC transporter permease [Oscillospiraceae bacterium]